MKEKTQKKYPYRPLYCECGKNIEGLDSNWCEMCTDDYMEKIRVESAPRSRFCDDAI